LTRDSIAIAIEALSWMAYQGLSERAALLKAADEVSVNDSSAIREAHRQVMETSRFQNKLENLITQVIPEGEFAQISHGIRSLLLLITFSKFVDRARDRELERLLHFGREILGWKELKPYEESIARLAKGKLSLNLDHLTETERLAIDTCHPNWYVERLTSTFDRATVLRILQRDLHPLPTFVRVNTLKTTNEEVILTVLDGQRVERVKNALKMVGKSRPDARRELLADGQIVIQDLASSLTCLVASPRPGQRVLDVCAAPGNKTTHLAAEMQNDGQIYSIEFSTTRIPQWKREVERTGCSIAQIVRSDARSLPVEGRFDLVLVDPPCSNTGVFARNPAAKWGTSYGKVRDLSARQEAILQSSSRHVNNGGCLVYCTCSILPEENEFVLETFLKKNHEFSLVPQDPFIGSPGLRGLESCQRLYPHLHECNGYFIAKMRREV
jgi:16S rRNA C967 or C1407 C5-methylase (RsmB/RsmF family)